MIKVKRSLDDQEPKKVLKKLCVSGLLWRKCQLGQGSALDFNIGLFWILFNEHCMRYTIPTNQKTVEKVLNYVQLLCIISERVFKVCVV